MTKLDFATGDRVKHLSMGFGTVESMRGGRVIVKYDDWDSRGEYDDDWFRIHPELVTKVDDSR